MKRDGTLKVGQRGALKLERIPDNPYLRYVEGFDGAVLIDRLRRDREHAMATGRNAVFRALCWLEEAHRAYAGPNAKFGAGESPFAISCQILEMWLRERGVTICRRPSNKRQTQKRAPVAGCVYFISAGEDGFIKIGFTGDITARLQSFATGSPHQIRLLLSIPSEPAFERELHKRFAPDRVRRNGEWFRLSDDLKAFIAAEKAKQAAK